MKAIQICGYHQSGKTTTVKELVTRLKLGGNSVATIKDIHIEGFELDQPDNSNSYIHKKAGADLVVISAEKETDFLHYRSMEFLEIAHKISADWLVVEGFSDFPLPKIVCGKTEQEVDDLFDQRTIAISGVISQTHQEYRSLPVFNPMIPEQADALFKLVSDKIFPMLPYVDDKCCNLCGMTCSKMAAAIVQGEKTYDDCLINRTTVHLKIGDREIKIVPFVQTILKNNVLALVRELNGWEDGQPIEVTIERE